MASIILGPRVIGKEAAKRAAERAVDHVGGGAIQVGSRIANKKVFGAAKAAAPVPASPAPVAPIADSPAAEPPKAAKRGRDAEPETPTYSEDQVESLLADDPNSWDIIAEAEARRPDGWRPRVATMLAAAGKMATTKPMAEEIQNELERIALVAAKADEDKLAVAAGAVKPEAAETAE